MTSDAENPASVPAELVEQWYDEYDTHIMQLCDDHIRFAQYISNKAAAYGREQAQWVPAAIRNEDSGELQSWESEDGECPDGWTMLFIQLPDAPTC